MLCRARLIASYAAALFVALGCRDMPTSLTPLRPTADLATQSTLVNGGLSVTLVELPIHCDFPGAKCGRIANGYAINDEGTVVGKAEFHSVLDLYNFDGAVWPMGGDIQRVRWSAYPGQVELIALRGVNNGGDLLGVDWIGTGNVFVNGQVIGQPAGYPAAAPVAINEQGEVVGYGDRGSSGPDRAFVWTSAGGMRVLEYRLDPGSTDAASSRPYDINDRGMAVGVVDTRGVLWDTRQGGVVQLAPTFGVSTVLPTGINNKGEIVGSLTGYTGGGASSGGFFWSPITGIRIIDVHAANAINDSSVVLGDGYIWTPRHGRLTMTLPTGSWAGALLAGKINNRNQLPGTVFTNGYMCCSRAARFDIQLPPPNQQPAASARGPYAGVEGTAITFDGGASSDPENQPLSYIWNFGDGTTATVAAPNHSYADNGTYVVQVAVSDPLGASDTATTQATIENVSPIVRLEPPATILSGDSFTAHTYFSDPGPRDMPWQYSIDWSIGASTQGSTDTQSIPPTTSPRYCAAGNYAIRAQVIDKDGGTGTASSLLIVNRLTIPVDILTETLNPRAKGALPVAILGTPSFDARQLDVSTVTLGSATSAGVPVVQRPSGSSASSVEDVNGDGRPDLVLRFPREALAESEISAGPTSILVLRGRLLDGCREVIGQDEIRVLGRI